MKNEYNYCDFYYIVIMNEEIDPNSWAYLIPEAIKVYIVCLINVNIFTYLIEFPCIFKDTLEYAYVLTIFMYIMKVLTGVQKLVL